MTETLRILVTDDEEGMRRGVIRALERFVTVLPELNTEVRFSLQGAATGEEALEQIAAEPPDILLLDYKLPGLSGLDVLERMGEQCHDLPVIMITAYASIDTAVMATKRGAYDFLPKPFTPEDLKATVRKAARHLVIQREARRLAAEQHQVRFQFLSVLAHELKAPLAAIEGYLNLLRDHTLGNEVADYGVPIDRSLARLDGMRKLILDLLDLTRIESGTRQRELLPLDLVEVARTALETVQPSADERGIALALHADGSVQLVADRGELEIILNNLVSNAVKYNRDRGRVDVTLKSLPDSVEIRVADTGIGMTTEESAKLFGEFVRIKNAKTRTIPGSGLGLSIVRKLANMYQGTARVESQPDVGTTFTVTLGRTGG
ncbi:MAG: HAMP domain-containing sensor histidine kinase [Polyangia bacterium]|jgi:signal transduction histidine kinase|nr:HAMP domain-containing sensor histidine kinase [Polyangia bacterium]